MSKITNLIGTTWRLGDNSLDGVSAAYGMFVVDANGKMIGLDNGVPTMELDGVISTAFLCGYPHQSISGQNGIVSVVATFEGNNYNFTLPMVEDGLLVVYEFTITGGTDISNPLFIDFINTYGTLVSGGEPPTAEGVKSKLQSLITASNAKTGKSDANLTDAVKTLLEGYGQGGGGGGECSGKHIIECDTLPEVGEDGTIYGVTAFTSVVLNMGGTLIDMGEGGEFNGVIATSVTLPNIEGGENMMCYVTDIPDVYMYWGGEWQSVSQMGMGGYLGDITTIDEADTSTNGYYAVMGTTLYKYSNGQYKQLVTKGVLKYETKGDGTCEVVGIEPNYDTNIDIPSVAPNGDSVTSIGQNAFKDCSGLTSITISDGVTSIGSKAFYGCSSLTSITIPNSVTSIGEYAFYKCMQLTSITIPDSVTSIGESAFSGCKSLTSVTIPNGVTSISNRVFEHCTGLTSITIPNGVTSIGALALNSCLSLKTITIPNSVTNISENVFGGCKSLTNITIPDSVTSMGINEFNSCSGLTSITFDENSQLTTIDGYMFRFCTSLTSITIPDSVKTIGSNAFEGCSALTSIAFAGTMEQWNAITKGSNWKYNVPATKVVCTDGEVAL
jgi:hypothetical protein